MTACGLIARRSSTSCASIRFKSKSTRWISIEPDSSFEAINVPSIKRISRPTDWRICVSDFSILSSDIR